jgi:hypothetical protein
MNKCPHIRGMGPPKNPMGPSLGPMGGVAQVSVNLPFHTQPHIMIFQVIKHHRQLTIVRSTVLSLQETLCGCRPEVLGNLIDECFSVGGSMGY